MLYEHFPPRWVVSHHSHWVSGADSKNHQSLLPPLREFQFAWVFYYFEILFEILWGETRNILIANHLIRWRLQYNCHFGFRSNPYVLLYSTNIAPWHKTGSIFALHGLLSEFIRLLTLHIKHFWRKDSEWKHTRLHIALWRRFLQAHWATWTWSERFW